MTAFDHVPLHSRTPFVRACPRESPERVLDARDRAFASSNGA